MSLANAIKTLVGGSDELLDAAVRKANFDRWFGRSKVVDHQGQPRVQYHGTPGDFDTFNQGELGFHFGTKNAANEILYKVLDGEDANIMPVHLAIQNPVQLPDMMQWDVPQAWDQHWLGPGTGYQGEYLRDLRARNKIFEVVQRHGGAYNDSPSDQFAQDMRAALQALGYDGVKYHNRVEDPGKVSWIAFDPTQIKSAVGNRGTFDPTDPNILRAAAPVAAGGLGAAALAAPEESEAGIGLDRLASMARPVNEVRQALGSPVLGEHVYPMADLILDMQKKAATAGVDPRDLLKSYGITTASIQRRGQNADLFPPELRGAETGVLRPEDAAANFFMSQPGQDYLGSAVEGAADPRSVQFIREAFRSYGRHENLGDLMAAAPQTVLPDLSVVQQMIAGGMSPEEILAFFASPQHFPGIGVAKAGFALPLLGRGDLPVLDARQANVHWGAGGADAVAALKAKDKTQAVKILADRQKELAYQMPKRYEPVRQYATHHDVWDRSAGTKTTHQPIIDTMRYGAAAPAAVGLAGLASPEDTRAAKLNRDMTHQPFQVPAVAATVSDLMRDMLLDPAGYLGPLEPSMLGNGEQLPPGELARLLSGGGGGY